MPVQFPDLWIDTILHHTKLWLLGRAANVSAPIAERVQHNRRRHVADHLLTAPESSAWRAMDPEIDAAIAAVEPHSEGGDASARFDIAKNLWARNQNLACHKSAEALYDRYNMQIATALTQAQEDGSYAVLWDLAVRIKTLSNGTETRTEVQQLRLLAVGREGVYVVCAPAHHDIKSAYMPHWGEASHELEDSAPRTQDPLPREARGVRKAFLRWKDRQLQKSQSPPDPVVERYRAYLSAMARLWQKYTAAVSRNAVVRAGRVFPFRKSLYDDRPDPGGRVNDIPTASDEAKPTR